MIHENPRYGTVSRRGIHFVDVDGQRGKVLFTPERSIRLQFDLGADLMICLDDCPRPDASPEEVRTSVERTVHWAGRCRAEFDRLWQARGKRGPKPLLFGVIQGGYDLSLLVEYGFLYDSSLFAGDFQPYHPRLGDRVGVEEPLQVGQEVDLWEFPVDFCLDDWPHFTFNFDPLRVGLSAPSKVLEIWAGEFDYMVEHEPGGVLTLTMHPQVIGRGHRLALLETFIQHVRAREGARFARMGDVARALSAGEG